MFTLLAVLHVLGLTVLLFGATMLVPLMVAWVGSDAALLAYDESILITMASGFVVWWGTRRYKRELQPRDGFLLVSLTWTTLPAFATLPLLFYFQQNGTPLSFTDAYFETVSGLTTSGASLDKRMASFSGLAWRHGHPGTGSGHFAAAGGRWQPALQG
jgi:trk system potassium uptake protein TrkH